MNMIESCNTQRMLMGVLFLGGLTFMVLYIESYWADSESSRSTINSNTSNGECWLIEKAVVDDCRPCTAFEITSKSITACGETNYIELVHCEKSGKAYRSCTRVTWIEERRFWKFEFVSFILCAIFSYIVFLRQRVLDNRVMQRLQKQLSNYP